MILGSIISLGASELYRFCVPSREAQALQGLESEVARSQRKPSFQFFVNDLPIPTNSTIVATLPAPTPHYTILIPTATSQQEVSIQVRNTGNLPADKLEVVVQFPAGEANFVGTGNWKDFPGLITVSQNGIASRQDLRCYRTVSQNLIPQSDVYACHKLLLKEPITTPRSLRLFLTASAVSSEIHAVTITLIFSKGSGKPSLHRT